MPHPDYYQPPPPTPPPVFQLLQWTTPPAWLSEDIRLRELSAALVEAETTALDLHISQRGSSFSLEESYIKTGLELFSKVGKSATDVLIMILQAKSQPAYLVPYRTRFLGGRTPEFLWNMLGDVPLWKRKLKSRLEDDSMSHILSIMGKELTPASLKLFCKSTRETTPTFVKMFDLTRLAQNVRDLMPTTWTLIKSLIKGKR
ncbi:hypothetical protein CONPUDRAFT_160360 [Coniophora puteana RWD-64-598 SS2]|uniref:Uncharacterized protein n=1 Tax=Coniophora puteana (strain RWD-64-598) TaxID=741705 RepID=R7SG89_CONPW|nr:uncharacterized protein CONPUDRAFT_160360 [Coniophora puteana RWD-64-598 SS2]EIW74104.1 hypothetical protein CONPUDRAFT_160360 [Coniophora puteana RWD-64-598 SS2]